jgi:hypothetical protein
LLTASGIKETVGVVFSWSEARKIPAPEEAKNLGGERVLRLIQIRLATSSVEKITTACQASSLRPRITDSNSTNALSFSSARTTNAFRRRDVRLQSRLFARWNQSLRRSPTPTGFAQIISDDFPVAHVAADEEYAVHKCQ